MSEYIKYKKLVDAQKGDNVEWHCNSFRKDGVVVSCNENQLIIQSCDVYYVVLRDGSMVDVWLHYSSIPNEDIVSFTVNLPSTGK